MDLRRLESFVFEKMAATRLPGLSLALVKGSELVYARGFGQRDLQNGLPATPGTLFSIGSITKSFTSLAIMQLAERGLLDPGDPVEEYLSFEIRPQGKKVRLEHLMSHTSGIPALAYSEAVIAYANGTGGRWLPIAGPEDVLTFMDGAAEWAESRPGERWAYSNEGYALLGLIIERVSGQSYDDYLRENILEPLGMERSFLQRAQVEAQADVAVPYVLPAGSTARPGSYLYRRIRSEGGLISCVTDLAHYLSMYLAKGRGVAKQESIAAMLEPRIEGPFRSSALFGAEEGGAAAHYGYGLVTEELLGRRMVGHGGSVLVSTAYLAFLPEEGLGVAVLANGTGYPMGNFARAALAAALEHDPSEVRGVALEDTLTRLTGNYRTYRATMEASVERQGDFLKLRFADRSTAEEIILVPEELGDETLHFFSLSDGLRLPVTFRVLDEGMELLYERHKLRRVGTR